MNSLPDSTNPLTADSSNPFEVSPLFQGAKVQGQQKVPPSSWFFVSGNLLICGPTVVLPALCAINLSEKMLEPNRVWVNYPSMKFVFTMRTCNVVYFLSKPARVRRSICRMLCILAFIAGIALLPTATISASQMASLLMAVTGLSLILLSILVLSLQSPRLRLIRYEAPGIYYIKGFCKRFLDKLHEHSLANSRPASLSSSGK